MHANPPNGIKDRLLDICKTPISWIIEPVARHLRQKMHVRQEIAVEVSVSEEWSEITATSPMKINRRFQRVDLLIDGPGIIDDSNRITLTNGRTAFPEIQIVDEFDHSYDLRALSGWERQITLRSEIQLPRDRHYTRLRIRSGEPFQCSKITWHNYNMK